MRVAVTTTDFWYPAGGLRLCVGLRRARPGEGVPRGDTIPAIVPAVTRTDDALHHAASRHPLRWPLIHWWPTRRYCTCVYK